jgi:hypothetical protein
MEESAKKRRVEMGENCEKSEQREERVCRGRGIGREKKVGSEKEIL